MNRLVSGVIVSLLFLTALAADSQKAKVVGVHDGDTITVLFDGRTSAKVRLQGIDAPELGQPFGKASKHALSDLVFNAFVEVKATGKDRYGRTLANIYESNLWINKELIKRGMAWHYTKYSSDPDLANAELAARKSKVGLWQEPSPTPPWQWRYDKKH